MSGVSTVRAAPTVAIIGILVTAWGAEFIRSPERLPADSEAAEGERCAGGRGQR